MKVHILFTSKIQKESGVFGHRVLPSSDLKRYNFNPGIPLLTKKLTVNQLAPLATRLTQDPPACMVLNIDLPIHTLNQVSQRFAFLVQLVISVGAVKVPSQLPPLMIISMAGI